MKYRVFYLNNYLGSFSERTDALLFIMNQTKRTDYSYHYGDFEILDGSDFL